MSHNMHFGLRGLFSFRIGRLTEDGEFKQRAAIGPVKNLILNSGLNALGAANTNDNLAYIQIGDGTTTPAVTDTALVSWRGASATASASDVIGQATDGSGIYSYRRITRRFGTGTVSGYNLSEVGAASASTSGLFSRALIQEAGGSPVTIALESDEILDVIYELRCYVDSSTQTISATIDGVANTVTVSAYRLDKSDSYWVSGLFPRNLGRPFYMNKGAREIIAYETAPTGSIDYDTSGISAGTPTTYVDNSFKRTYTATFDITQFNFTTGIGAIIVRAGNSGWSERTQWPQVLYTFSPKLNKTSVRKATFIYSCTWGRLE